MNKRLQKQMHDCAARNRFHTILKNSIKNEGLEGDEWAGVKVDKTSGELFLYDVIGWPFITALDVVKLAKEIDGDTITLRLNSYGGDVFEAFAIYNALKTIGKTVNVMIDGIAASAASYIAMVGKTITIADNAMMMIHNPITIVWGDAGEMRKAADLLDQIKDAIALTYAKRPNVDKEEIKGLMEDETWFLGQAAVDAGLADSVGEAGVGYTPSETATAMFKNAPKISKPSNEGKEKSQVLKPVDYFRRQQALAKAKHHE